ncbi:hypothetical protein Ef22C036LT_41790 (plasmid) [Escherichia fergusonii]|uniref:hypothetical protein n=1 Tax=Escherichia fergusonii TaxID=564 RepID=UPI0029235ECC|nr:hypothetical protein Ef22C036LT_41790 [Escherichia fergusonii]
MKNLLDTEGTVLFPFQTEIHFIWTIFSTVKRLVIGTRGPYLPEAILERLSLYFASYGLCGSLCCGGLVCSALAEGLYSVEICGFGTMGHASKARTTLGYR